jgi:hypothetical protein
MREVKEFLVKSPEHPFVLRYSCALASVLLATWVRAMLHPVLGDHDPFVTLLFAILVTAWYGGVLPALTAVLLGVVLAD